MGKHSSWTPKKRIPAEASSLIERAIGSPVIKKKLQQYAAFPFWTEVVGEELARITKPERITRGKVMVVRVLDAAWVQELTMRKPEFLDKIHLLNVGAVIEDIHFVSGDPKSI